jgi:hypothetical protein
MVVVIKLAAEFQIQLSSKLGDPLTDVGRLGKQIFLVVISDISHAATSFAKYSSHFTPKYLQMQGGPLHFFLVLRGDA